MQADNTSNSSRVVVVNSWHVGVPQCMTGPDSLGTAMVQRMQEGHRVFAVETKTHCEVK